MAMMRAAAFLCAAVGVVYADPGADHWWRGGVLPLLLVASVAYLFWFQGFVALGFGVVSWYFMDIAAGSWLTAGLLPLLFGACLVYFTWWLGLGLWAAPSQWNADISAADSGDTGDGDAS